MMRSDSDMTLGDFDIDSALQQMDTQVFQQGGQGAAGAGMDVDLMDLGMLLDDKRCEAPTTAGGDGCLAFLPDSSSSSVGAASSGADSSGAASSGAPAAPVPCSTAVKVKAEPID